MTYGPYIHTKPLKCKQWVVFWLIYCFYTENRQWTLNCDRDVMEPWCSCKVSLATTSGQHKGPHSSELLSFLLLSFVCSLVCIAHNVQCFVHSCWLYLCYPFTQGIITVQLFEKLAVLQWTAKPGVACSSSLDLGLEKKCWCLLHVCVFEPLAPVLRFLFSLFPSTMGFTSCAVALEIKMNRIFFPKKEKRKKKKTRADTPH